MYPFATAGEALACVRDDAPEVVVTGAAAVLARLGEDALARGLDDEPPLVRAALLALTKHYVGEAGLRLLFSRAEAGGFEAARVAVVVGRMAARCCPN